MNQFRVHRLFLSSFFFLFFSSPPAVERRGTMPHPDLSIPLLPDAEHDLPLPHHPHQPQYTWPEAGPSSRPRGTSPTSSTGFLGNVDAEYAYTSQYPQSEIDDGRGRGKGRVRERQGSEQEQRRRADERVMDMDRETDTETDRSKAGIFGAKAIAAMTGAMATSLLSTSCVFLSFFFYVFGWS